METINITDLQAKIINEVGQPVLLEICKNYILSVEDRQILALLQKQITEKKLNSFEIQLVLVKYKKKSSSLIHQ